MTGPEAPHGPMLRFLLTHLLYGSFGAAVFCWAILRFDVAGIGTIIGRSDQPVLWQAMLYFGNWATFGGAAMAVAIMRLGEDGSRAIDD